MGDAPPESDAWKHCPCKNCTRRRSFSARRVYERSSSAFLAVMSAMTSSITSGACQLKPAIYSGSEEYDASSEASRTRRTESGGGDSDDTDGASVGEQEGAVVGDAAAGDAKAGDGTARSSSRLRKASAASAP